MRIHTHVVFDAETLETLSDASFEYQGEVALCGGGSGGGGTTRQVIEGGYDAAYNARMAAIAEQQQALAGQMFNFWRQYQAPLEAAQAASTMNVLPAQEEYLKSYLASQLGLMPSQAALEGRALDAQHQLLQPMLDVQMAQLRSNYETMPHLHAYGLESIDAARHLLPYMTKDQREALEASMQLRPYQTQDQKEALEASMQLRPHQTREELDRIAARGEVRGFGLEGVDINRRVGMAVADSQHAGDAQADAARRQLESMGVNPGSGAYVRMFRDQANDAMLNRSHAMNQARWSGEDDDWKRKLEAARL